MASSSKLSFSSNARKPDTQGKLMVANNLGSTSGPPSTKSSTPFDLKYEVNQIIRRVYAEKHGYPADDLDSLDDQDREKY